MQDTLQTTTSSVSNKLNSWWDTFIDNLPNLAVALMVMLISFLISKYSSNLIEKLVRKKVSKESIANIIGKIVAAVVVLVGLFLALSVMNLDEALKSLLTGAGIAGIVIGMALQGTLSNTIAGVVLSFRKNIKIGDWIDTNGFSGEVIDISLKEFTMKEADNNIVVIPNKLILEKPLKNYSLTSRMRVMLECGVDYNSDLQLVERITKETIANTFEQINNTEEVEFYYREYGDSAINFLCRFWIEGESSLETLRAKSKAIIKINQNFKEHNIQIPFPTRTLQFKNKMQIETNSEMNSFSNN